KRLNNFILSLQSEKRLIFRTLSSEGSYKVLEASVKNLLAEPTIRGLLLYARDITAKQAAEERLSQLKLVVEQNPSSIVITDLDGTIQYVNKQFEKVTGYTREEALGQNPKILNSGLTSPEIFSDMWETLQRDEIWNGEFINRSKSGEIYHENVILAPLKNDRDEVTHYVAVKENITELKQAREAAEASNKAKSDFLSRMSHELRTPLNAINGFSEILLRKNKKHTLDERQTDQVIQINTAGKHLLELINEILDLSRIESGQLTATIEPVVVADMVRDCIALIGSLALETGISIEVEKSIDQLPAILADRTRIKQVLLNLLSNAIKYNRPQGTVSISGKLGGNIVSLLVKDSGIGISEKQIDKLFIPFTRLGQDKSGIEGTGIGMTITKQLVELMKGSLKVESEVGIGSTFIVNLPLAEKVIKQKPQSSEPSQSQNSLSEIKKIKGTVIYIEDDPASIQLMRSIMEQWPEAALVIRKNAEKGIKAVAMLQPDLVFMDLQLPGMSGQEAFAELQNNPKTKDITVLALSADASPETIKKYLNLGFAEYLTKPITTAQLSNTLEEYWPS
ncbi:MAG: PAS domain S-box protein, partial [Desulfocapsa sp.]|nr:PAS domain S-box protein [Desulfocapsa sp.]